MVMVSYLFHYGTLLQNTICYITKCDSYFITNCQKVYYKMCQVFLQNATVLLQNATVKTKCVDFITNCDDYHDSYGIYYKIRRYNNLKSKSQTRLISK